MSQECYRSLRLSTKGGVGKRAEVQLLLLSEVRYKAPFRSLLSICWFYFFRCLFCTCLESVWWGWFWDESRIHTSKKSVVFE